MAKHQAPDRHPVRDRAAIRTTALAMIGLTLFVIAMIASYSGAFAKPTLHHMAVAVAGPQQVVDGIRGQESLAVTKVDDDAAARKQVYLREFGWIEGKNIVFDQRYADNNLDRLPELARELVHLDVDVIVTVGTLAPLAVKRATTSIPIVMVNAGDPVRSGLVASLARPGGNVTGMSLMAPDLGGKRLELLKETLPRLSHVAIIWNAANPYSALVFDETQSAAKKLTVELQSLEVRSPGDFDGALAATLRNRVDALVIVEDPLTYNHLKKVAEFCANNRLPAIYGLREFADAGGLMTYGASNADLYRRSVEFVDKILRGVKPSDLPVQQPTKFELMINLNTAKLLGLEIPSTFLARADEVIE